MHWADPCQQQGTAEKVKQHMLKNAACQDAQPMLLFPEASTSLRIVRLSVSSWVPASAQCSMAL